MAILDRLFGWHGADRAAAQLSAAPVTSSAHPAVMAYDSWDLKHGYLADFMKGGSDNAANAVLSGRAMLRNAGVFRCVTVISNAIGMLPLHLMRVGHNSGDREKAKNHPLYDLLAYRPNGWQTSFEFRRLMQHRVLTDGNAYALRAGPRARPTALIPLDPKRVRVVQLDDFSVVYKYQPRKGGVRTIPAEEMLHIYGPSEDGLRGLALVDYAAEVLGLAIRAQEAAARLFRNGVLAGGVLSTEGKLSPEGFANIKASLEEHYSGAENAHKWIVAEQGMKATPMAGSARDAQNVETRQHQIEEIARIFGVPRPFLMVDDTSWGSGIEQLGLFFVQYGLAPWFVAWEQAIARTLLSDQDRKTHYAKFNERALLRGSMQDQAEFLAKMLGSGGHPQVMEVNEVRDLLDMPPHQDGEGLSRGMGARDDE